MNLDDVYIVGDADDCEESTKNKLKPNKDGVKSRSAVEGLFQTTNYLDSDQVLTPQERAAGVRLSLNKVTGEYDRMDHETFKKLRREGLI